MDSEVKDKPNKCETEESSVESSTVNNNNTLKEGVKKIHSVNTNTEDGKMEVDGEETSSDKFSEKKNGVSEDVTKGNQNSDIQTDKEKLKSNHDQSNSNEKELFQNSVNDEQSALIHSEEKCNSETEANKQNSDKDNESSSTTIINENSNENHKSETDSVTATDVEKPMDVGSSSDAKDSSCAKSPNHNSEKPESEKDNVRPADEASKNSTESAEMSKTVENAEKNNSLDKEAKEKSNSEVSNETVNSKETKGKENENVPNENKAESKTESTKKEGEPTKKKKSKTCEECGVKKGLKFQVLFKGKTRFLCSDTCFKNFKSKQMQSKTTAETTSASTVAEQPTSVKCVCQKEIVGTQGFYPVIGEAKPLCSEDCMKKYVGDNIPVKSCSQCEKVIENPQNPDMLTWETMVFCNDDCLGKYQSYLGSHCTCCQSPVPQSSLGKYSVCFGADIRQFCSCNCLDEFKKNLKVCSFCQTDLSAGIDSFLAPVGDKGQFKDFCSQNCMERYEVMNNISKSAPQVQVCSHCKKQGTYKIQVKHDNETYSLCSDMCVAGFRCSHKIKDRMCDTCFNFFTTYSNKDFSFKFDGLFKQFCTKACMTLFVLSHRRIVACVSCKVKKYNFDMIEKTDASNQVQIFCSLNCLSLYRVSVNATSSKSVRCDNCTKTLPAQYHLTMSDGSVRNFCTYNCVILFQKQYTNVCTLTTAASSRQTTATTATSKTSSSTATPVISNVVSLAGAPRTAAPALIKVPTRPPMQPVAIIGSKIYSVVPATRADMPVLAKNHATSKLDADQQPLPSLSSFNDSKPTSSTITSPSTMGTMTTSSGQQVVREVIVKPPAPKSQKNKSVACKPIMQNKGINVKPQPCHKAVQTDDSPRPILLPIPVPVYIPTPFHMFSRPVPCPVPFPVPIPVPIIIPASKDSSNQDRMPPNPVPSNMFMMSDKISEDGCSNRKDISKESSNFLKEKSDSRVDEAGQNMREGPSPAFDEFNDFDDDDDDQYQFPDSQCHGKRRAPTQLTDKRHKKHRNDDNLSYAESRQHTASAEESRNSTVQNEHPESVPSLKVP